jgi:hypothetical protein
MNLFCRLLGHKAAPLGDRAIAPNGRNEPAFMAICMRCNAQTPWVIAPRDVAIGILMRMPVPKGQRS